MLKADQIPPDAMYAAWKAMNAGMTLNDAIAAALNAWPGSYSLAENDSAEIRGVAAIILPLPLEVSDDT